MDSWHSESQSCQMNSRPQYHSLSTTPEIRAPLGTNLSDVVRSNGPHVFISSVYDFNLTILLFTSSSMALTSSAALGVSELLGRAFRRDAD